MRVIFLFWFALASALSLMTGCTTDDEPEPRRIFTNGEIGDVDYTDVFRTPPPSPPPINVGVPPGPPPEETVIIVEDDRFCPYLPRHSAIGAPDNCCFMDEDCLDDRRAGTIPIRCYGAICRTRGEGICKPMPLTPRDCWTTDDCQPREVCSGATISACGERAMVPDIMGHCIQRPGAP
ncbi:MAG: hypothetical protein ACNA8W_09850 [Bradymonadaceae bacterium]